MTDLIDPTHFIVVAFKDDEFDLVGLFDNPDAAHDTAAKAAENDRIRSYASIPTVMSSEPLSGIVFYRKALLVHGDGSITGSHDNFGLAQSEVVWPTDRHYPTWKDRTEPFVGYRQHPDGVVVYAVHTDENEADSACEVVAKEQARARGMYQAAQAGDPSLAGMDPEIAGFMGKLYADEQAGDRMPLSVGPYTMISMVGALQLALRNPAFTGTSSNIVRRLVEHTKLLFAGTPAERLIELGNNPAYDVPQPDPAGPPADTQ